MNELKLSDSLSIIETEIRQYQNLAGESIFEIGRRLKHVKENDLVHGEFGKWLERVGLDKSQASRFIKIVEEHGNKIATSQKSINILYEIATLPEPERTKEHVTSKGENKTPDEMTVKELRELKSQIKRRDEQLKERDSQLETVQRENEILQTKVEKSEDIEPQVIEREVIKEVVPDHINNQLEELKRKANRQTETSETLRAELKKYTDAFNDPQSAYDEKEEKRLERDSSINAYKLAISIQKFIESNAVETYKVASVIKSNEAAKERLKENVELLKDFTDNLEAILNGRIFTK